jgi:hypothetical protein
MKRVELSPEQVAKTAFPGGRLPLKGAKSSPSGGDWTNISDGGPNAIAAKAEREQTRSRPDLAAKRGAPVFK